MLPEKQIFRLMLMHCAPFLLISGAGTLAAAGVLAFVGRELITEVFVINSILKMGLVAAAVVLLKLLSREGGEYFYINLGQHPNKLLKMGICLDLAIYFSLSILIIILRNVFFS